MYISSSFDLCLLALGGSAAAAVFLHPSPSLSPLASRVTVSFTVQLWGRLSLNRPQRLVLGPGRGSTFAFATKRERQRLLINQNTNRCVSGGGGVRPAGRGRFTFSPWPWTWPGSGSRARKWPKSCEHNNCKTRNGQGGGWWWRWEHECVPWASDAPAALALQLQVHDHDDGSLPTSLDMELVPPGMQLGCSSSAQVHDPASESVAVISAFRLDFHNAPTWSSLACESPPS